MQNSLRNKGSFYIIASFMLFLSIYCVFLLSLGSFDLKKQFAFTLLFQNIWEHLTHGSLAVDKDLIGMEGFDVNVITTAYFLPFPSLIRGILSTIGYGESAILSVLLGALIFTSGSLLIWRLIFRAILMPQGAANTYYWISGALVCTLLSPILGMMSFPTPFWEVIVWASALFLLASYLSIRVIQNYSHNKGYFLFYKLPSLWLNRPIHHRFRKEAGSDNQKHSWKSYSHCQHTHFYFLLRCIACL